MVRCCAGSMAVLMEGGRKEGGDLLSEGFHASGDLSPLDWLTLSVTWRGR